MVVLYKGRWALGLSHGRPRRSVLFSAGRQTSGATILHTAAGMLKRSRFGHTTGAPRRSTTPLSITGEGGDESGSKCRGVSQLPTTRLSGAHRRREGETWTRGETWRNLDTHFEALVRRPRVPAPSLATHTPRNCRLVAKTPAWCGTGVSQRKSRGPLAAPFRQMCVSKFPVLRRSGRCVCPSFLSRRSGRCVCPGFLSWNTTTKARGTANTMERWCDIARDLSAKGDRGRYHFVRRATSYSRPGGGGIGRASMARYLAASSGLPRAS